MARGPLYAQFHGDEIDGKFYGLGDEIDESVDAGTIAYLVGSGRISAAKPGKAIMVPSGDKAPEDMSRAELEAAVRDLIPMGDATDERLIRDLHDLRGTQPEPTDAGEKPLAKQTTAELEATAAAESVTFGEDVKTNADRIKAIEDARAAK